MRSYYEILGVAATASRDEIRRAYLAGARRLHPDTGAADQRGMQVLNEAWTVLRDPRRRRAYDRTLGLPAETPRAIFSDDPIIAFRTAMSCSGVSVFEYFSFWSAA